MSKLSRHRRMMGSYWDDRPGLFDLPAEDENSAEAPLDALPEECLRRPDYLRYISFGSGSSGNCAYVGTSRGGIIVDAGVDNNFVLEQMALNAIDPANVAGIMLTHDHGDHVRYAYALLRRHRHWHLFATPKALNGMLRRHNVSRRVTDYHQPIFKEFTFTAGPLRITPFETSHDGTDNVGFFIEGGSTTLAITTDTGIVTERADHYMRQARHLVLESNYDLTMLTTGPYPLYLQSRIRSEMGHMDNSDTAAYLRSIYRPELSTVLLCHLSEENNTPELALEASRRALIEAGAVLGEITDSLEQRRGKLTLSALPRKSPSPLLLLE